MRMRDVVDNIFYQLKTRTNIFQRYILLPRQCRFFSQIARVPRQLLLHLRPLRRRTLPARSLHRSTHPAPLPLPPAVAPVHAYRRFPSRSRAGGQQLWDQVLESSSVPPVTLILGSGVWHFTIDCSRYSVVQLSILRTYSPVMSYASVMYAICTSISRPV
jgi:hypothetical protein